jgi:hypothetical protein
LNTKQKDGCVEAACLKLTYLVQVSRVAEQKCSVLPMMFTRHLQELGTGIHSNIMCMRGGNMRRQHALSSANVDDAFARLWFE